MSVLEQICSNSASYAAAAGWLAWATSEAIGFSSLRSNTTIGLLLSLLQAAFPYEIHRKEARRARTTKRRPAPRRRAAGAADALPERPVGRGR